jgi:hypothetical protein
MRILTVFALFVALFALGCSNPATPIDNSQIEGFFAGVSPNPTGVIGDYTFTANDGSIETGALVRGDDGQITMQSDRGASVYSNFWFDILVEYDPSDVRYYTGMGLPVYYLGDTFTYYINIDYKRGLPLNIPGFLTTTLTSQQRYWPGGGLLPGASTEVWDPFYIAPYENLVVPDDYYIVPGTIPGNDATWVAIDLQFLGGFFHFNMAAGAMGFWDP